MQLRQRQGGRCRQPGRSCATPPQEIWTLEKHRADLAAEYERFKQDNEFMEGELSSMRSTVSEQMQQITTCKVCGRWHWHWRWRRAPAGAARTLGCADARQACTSTRHTAWPQGAGRAGGACAQEELAGKRADCAHLTKITNEQKEQLEQLKSALDATSEQLHIAQSSESQVGSVHGHVCMCVCLPLSACTRAHTRLPAHMHTHACARAHTQLRVDKEHYAKEADRFQDEAARLGVELNKAMKVGWARDLRRPAVGSAGCCATWCNHLMQRPASMPRSQRMHPALARPAQLPRGLNNGCALPGCRSWSG